MVSGDQDGKHEDHHGKLAWPGLALLCCSVCIIVMIDIDHIYDMETVPSPPLPHHHMTVGRAAKLNDKHNPDIF